MSRGGFYRVRDEFIERARRVAEVAGSHSAEVDEEGRFPSEALAALREERLLGLGVPADFGGMGAGLAELAEICSVLAERCATTGIVYAMHQSQLLSVVRHGGGTAFFQRYLAECASEQRLVASATTEIGVGGDTRTSQCAIEASSDGSFALVKQAPVVSYGAHADSILATARRASDAPPNDQVLVLLRREEYSLERTSDWDTLGMRGTCSAGFVLRGHAPLEHVLPAPFANISSETMHPASHVLWAHVWLGIATSAVSAARAFVRAEARKAPRTVPKSALRVAELVNQLHVMRGSVRDAMDQYGARYDDRDALAGLGFQIRMNNLKIATAEQVVPIVCKAMSICGIAGYRNGSRYSLGRHLRDAQGATVMISNDRLYDTNASLLLISKED